MKKIILFSILILATACASRSELERERNQKEFYKDLSSHWQDKAMRVQAELNKQDAEIEDLEARLENQKIKNQILINEQESESLAGEKPCSVRLVFTSFPPENGPCLDQQ